MKDRVKIGNGKSSTLMCPSGYAPADFAAFLTDLKNGDVYVDISPNNSTGSDAGVTEVGTPLNKSNILSDTTATKYGYSASDNPTLDEVLSKVGDNYVYITGTLAAGSTTLTLTDSRITASGLYDIYIDPYGVYPESVTTSAGSMVMTFIAQPTAVTVKVRIL